MPCMRRTIHVVQHLNFAMITWLLVCMLHSLGAYALQWNGVKIWVQPESYCCCSKSCKCMVTRRWTFSEGRVYTKLHDMTLIHSIVHASRILDSIGHPLQLVNPASAGIAEDRLSYGLSSCIGYPFMLCPVSCSTCIHRTTRDSNLY